MDDSQDICRVCRSEASPDRPLFYPCVCTGSIKYIHQDCLTQWLRYSRKEYCELCNHRFSFTPIYAPDMPKRLPIRDVIHGLLTSVGTAFRFWLHYTLVAFAWLGVVPLSACRIHRSLFTGSVTSILSLPIDLVSTENIIIDIAHGCFVVMCALSVFISLVWLREHIVHGGGPEWLMDHQPAEENNEAHEPLAEDEPVVEDDIQENGNENVREELLQNQEVPAHNNNNNRRARVERNDELNWPMDWDRAGEELTWEKLLGLDGSLLFIEHVFWVISLNTLCIVIFEFSPYHIGYYALAALKMQEWIQYAHFEGLLTTLVGYLIIGFSLVLLHAFASIFRLRKTRKIIGISYVVVKVCLLCVVEIGIFPLLCGWWLDICSLPLFDASLKDREASFVKAPGTSMFMHWLFGMVYVFYFASFILLLREVLRPGVLWFLRNLNDPDFNPVQEMIQLPIAKHIRRFLFSGIIFGTTTLLMIWVPIRVIKKLSPTFLPYNFTFTTETTHEMSLELVLLQVMMPALLEQGHTREWMKYMIRGWCICASWFLDLRSYLLGDITIEEQGNGAVVPVAPNEANVEAEPVEDGVDPIDGVQIENELLADVEVAEAFDLAAAQLDAIENQIPLQLQDQAVQVDEPLPGGLGFVFGGGLAAAHQALLLRDSPTEFHPYHCPKWFHLKICVLLLLICGTLSLVSFAVLIVPVSIGRAVMGYWLQTKGEAIHELYTTATGLYITWIGIRCMIILGTWIPKGWPVVWKTLQTWSLTVRKFRQDVFGVIKAAFAMCVLIGLVPYLCGLLFELVIITPIRIPVNQSPIHIASENWVMGTLYVKIACATTMMSPPNFWLRRTLERVYNNGIRNIDLNLIMRDLAAPCIAGFGLALAIPYVISKSIVPIFVTNMDMQNLVERRIFPLILVLVVIYGIILFQIRQFRKLYEHIKNDKYLVGRRLVNYERPPATPAIQAVPAAVVQ